MADVKRDERGRLVKGTAALPGGGRPIKPDSLTGLLRKFAEHKGPEGKLYREKLAKTIWLHAMAGEPRFIEILLTRCDGLPTQHIEQISTIEVSFADNWDNLEDSDTKPEQ